MILVYNCDGVTHAVNPNDHQCLVLLFIFGVEITNSFVKEKISTYCETHPSFNRTVFGCASWNWFVRSLGLESTVPFSILPQLNLLWFQLRKMKEPLRGIRFRTVPEILEAINSSIWTINIIGYAEDTLWLPHWWQLAITKLVTVLEDSKSLQHVFILYML